MHWNSRFKNLTDFCFLLKSFILEFHFEPNEYFTNEVLTKTYRMRSEPDDSDPFSFDGPEIMGCTGWVNCAAVFFINCRQSLQYYIPFCILLGCNLCYFPLSLAIACVFLGKIMLFTFFISCVIAIVNL